MEPAIKKIMTQVDTRLERFYFNNTNLHNTRFQVDFNIPTGVNGQRSDLTTVIEFILLYPDNAVGVAPNQIFSEKDLVVRMDVYGESGRLKNFNIMDFRKDYHPMFQTLDNIKVDIQKIIRLGFSTPFDYGDNIKDEKTEFQNIPHIDFNNYTMTNMRFKTNSTLEEDGLSATLSIERLDELIHLYDINSLNEGDVIYDIRINKQDIRNFKEAFKSDDYGYFDTIFSNGLRFFKRTRNCPIWEAVKMLNLLNEQLTLKTDFLEVIYDYIQKGNN